MSLQCTGARHAPVHGARAWGVSITCTAGVVPQKGHQRRWRGQKAGILAPRVSGSAKPTVRGPSSGVPSALRARRGGVCSVCALCARCSTGLCEIPTGSPSAWAVPLRLLRGCEARSEPLLRRERCHHRNVRACGAPRLHRVDTAWCTLTPNVHEAACTIPVVECSQGPFECSVYSSYSN